MGKGGCVAATSRLRFTLSNIGHGVIALAQSSLFLRPNVSPNLSPVRCGVFAYVNHGVVRPQQYIVDALLTGLRRLEYRGYDSAGIAIDDVTHAPSADSTGKASNGTVFETTLANAIVIKETGKIDNLAALVETRKQELGLDLSRKVADHAGIAHTRWVRAPCAPALHRWTKRRSGHPPPMLCCVICVGDAMAC